MTDYSIMTEQLKALAETDAHYVPLLWRCIGSWALLSPMYPVQMGTQMW